MRRLRVLLTNNTLAGRAGSELYVRDVATALLALGHRPVAYSSSLGEVAAELRRATVPVVDDLDRLGEPPDLIHGHHHVETMTALLRFPDTPAVYFCHGWVPWEELPLRFPRIRRYVAVDHTCRDRLVVEGGVRPEQVELVLNFVDLQRFRQRPPLPRRPARALVFSNNAQEGSYLEEVRRACADLGLTLDVLGRESGKPCPAPERELGRYDVVFAKARSALEALATGAAVVVCDADGCGPLVRAADLDRLRRLNFGIRCLTAPVTAGHVVRELRRYDRADAAAVTRRIRAMAGLHLAVPRLVALYERVLAEWAVAPRPDRKAEGQATAAYLRAVSPALQERSRVVLQVEGERLRRRLAQAGAVLAEERAARERLAEESARENARLLAQAGAVLAEERAARERLAEESARENARLRATAAAAAGEAEASRAYAERLRQSLREVEASPLLRLRDWAGRVPVVSASARYLLRGGQACWRGARRAAARLRDPALRHAPAPFIVGVARSGTTLLRLMLDAHPQFAIPAETGFIPQVAGLTGPPEELRRAFFDTVTAAPTWADLALPREEFREALEGVKPFTVADGVRCFYCCYARRHGKRSWGDKTPLYGGHMKAIQELLPEAHFIHIIRDGRDVALSLGGLWFSPGDSAEELARHWRERIEATRAQAADCRHYTEVRYEDLVRNPRGVLQYICGFLGLPFSPAMEEYHRGARARLDEVQTRHREDGTVLISKGERLHLQRLTGRKPDAGRIGKWKSEMSAADGETFRRIAGDLLRHYGYET